MHVKSSLLPCISSGNKMTPSMGRALKKLRGQREENICPAFSRSPSTALLPTFWLGGFPY